MKILTLFNRIPFPPNDGGAIAIYYLLKHLHSQGHDVHLAAVNTHKHYADPLALKDIATVYTSEIDTRITPWGALSSYFSDTPYIASRFYHQPFANILTNLLRSTQFDVIQVDLAYTMVYAAQIRSLTDTPLIFRPHNIESELWHRTADAEKHPLKRLYLSRMAHQVKKFELRVAQMADKIIAITDRDAEYFRTHLPTKDVVAIPAGVETSQFETLPVTETESCSIAFLGSLEWMPNLQGLDWFLEQVWPRIRSEVPEASFHIAGKNPPARISSLTVPGVVVHGQVASAPIFMRQHEVMVVPLLSGGGMRLKMVEGMAAGVPLVSTPVGAEGIEGTNGEHFLIAESPNMFADACVSLLRQPALRQKLATNATALTRARYDWEAITRRFISEYRTLKHTAS